jgi:hypothetical protein
MLIKETNMRTVTSHLQVKLTLDDGLNNVWGFLTKEYEGLDKTGIIRLALNTLAKTTKRQNNIISEKKMALFLSELDERQTGMTETEFTKWWNTHKKEII